MSGVDPVCIAYGHHTLRGVRACLHDDITRQLTMTPENAAFGDSPKRRISAFFRPEILALALHRISHYFHVKGWRWPARSVAAWNTRLHKNDISPESCIGPGCRMPHPPDLALHMRAGPGLTIYSRATVGAADGVVGGPLERAPKLGTDVTVGGLVSIVGAVQIGDGAKVGPMASVSTSVPERVYVVVRRSRIVRPEDTEL